MYAPPFVIRNNKLLNIGADLALDIAIVVSSVIVVVNTSAADRFKVNVPEEEATAAINGTAANFARPVADRFDKSVSALPVNAVYTLSPVGQPVCEADTVPVNVAVSTVIVPPVSVSPVEKVYGPVVIITMTDPLQR